MKAITANTLLDEVRPLVDKFARALAEAMAKSIAELRERALSAARASIEAELADKPTVRKGPKRMRAQQAEPPKPPPVKRVAASRKPKTCSKCGAVGFTARTCGTTHNIAPSSNAVATADDPEDEPRVPRRRRQPREADHVEERVIPHATLVAMLARDRAENARAGEAGGYIARADREPSLIGRTDEKRELCPVHGWVGRVAMEREHFACLPTGEPCTWCGGAKLSGPGLCDHCDGWGVEPPGLIAPTLEEVERPLAAANAKISHRDGHRRRTAPRKKTISVKRITRDELRVGGILNPPVDIPRPQTRGDCLSGGANECRPCGFVACKHHLYLDINPETGSITLNFPDVEPEDLVESCALDIAERGGITLEDVGNLTNLTRERVRQVEVKGLHALKATTLVKHGIGPGDFVDRGAHPLAEVEES